MKKIEKAKKTRSININGYIIAGIISLIVAVVGYAALVVAEDTVLGKYDKNDVYVANRDIATGTQLTPDMFTAHSIDSAIIPNGAVMDISKIENTYATIDIPKNMVVTEAITQSIADVVVGDKEIGINTSDLAGSVNGIMRASDYIDIYIVSNTFEKEHTDKTTAYVDNGDGTSVSIEETSNNFDVSVEATYKHVYVNRVFDGDGVPIQNGDTESLATRFNITLEQADADYLIGALQVGKVYVVIDHSDGTYSVTRPENTINVDKNTISNGVSNVLGEGETLINGIMGEESDAEESDADSDTDAESTSSDSNADDEE